MSQCAFFLPAQFVVIDFSPQICWYLAAVVQIQLCKYFIEINDTARESTVWGEINVLRYDIFCDRYGMFLTLLPTDLPC